MGRFGNSVLKGLNIAGHVVGGCLVYGVGQAIFNWHPTGVVGAVWNVAGITLAGGLIGAGRRFFGFDPSKAFPPVPNLPK